MDDLERAILYSFDETGAVDPDLKVTVSHSQARWLMSCIQLPNPRYRLPQGQVLTQWQLVVNTGIVSIRLAAEHAIRPNTCQSA